MNERFEEWFVARAVAMGPVQLLAWLAIIALLGWVLQ